MDQKSNQEQPDFTGKRPAKREEIRIDHDTGLMHVPGVGALPLVGPTSGSEYKQLKKSEAQFAKDRLELRRLMGLKWQCIQCRRVWPGTRVRVKKINPASEEVVFVCPDRRCDAPVIQTTNTNTGRSTEGDGEGKGR